MGDRDDFEPHLGKPRAPGGRRYAGFLARVLKAANRAGRVRLGARRGFHGGRSGRGAGAGRVLAARDRFAAFRARRVVVKSRIVRLDSPKGLEAARAHLRYLERDGVTREGEPGRLYSAENDRADGKAFLKRADGDRHQFRFIVSPEDGAHYDDLKPLTRRLMAQAERDLGTKLDWVAVDHFNTGHPHTHVIVRGKDDKGRDLVIARDYIVAGLRERAAELVSLDLGPRTDAEIENRLRAEIEQERLTGIDRRLLRDMNEAREVAAAARNPFEQTLRAGRLQTLARLGFAEEAGAGRWRLATRMEETLRRMGECGDIIRTMQRAFAEKGLVRAGDEYAIYDPAAPDARAITGRVAARGLSEEINDRRYLIVDGADGRSHYVDIGRSEGEGAGAVVRIEPKRAVVRAADRRVAEIAAANGGRYSVDIHLRHDPTATERFAQTHVRRLEAMRRIAGAAERLQDGTWIVAPDHIARAEAFEARLARAEPVVVRTLSHLPVERQVSAEGATWLDRELVAAHPEPLRDAGFGRAAREALAQRRQWLVGQGLAHEEQGRIVFRANMLGLLRRRDLARAAAQFSEELGLDYVETKEGERIKGRLRGPVDLASGRFALIEKAKEFTLVPWRDVLNQHIGRDVSGVAAAGGIDWAIGRQRGPSPT